MNSSVARRLAEFRASADAAREAFASGFSEPVPPRLIEAASRRPQKFARRVPVAMQLRPWMLAASIAIFAFVGGYFVAQTGPTDLRDTARVIAERLEARETGALTQISGYEAGIVASYETSSGYCRQISGAAEAGDALTAIACRGPGGWTVPLLLTGSSTLYAPASNAAAAAIEGFLDAVEAASPLAPGAERVAIERDWVRP